MKSQRRNLKVVYGVLAGVFLTLCLFCGVGVSLVRYGINQIVGSPLEVIEEDYAIARKDFKTKLIRTGSSPQEFYNYAAPTNARAVSYRSEVGELRAWVDEDPGDGQVHPGILFLHGGFAYGEGDWEMPQPYRDSGFIVMTPILRAENGWPGSFTLYFDEVDDVLAAAGEFARLPYVDGDNIFVAGHSAGGTLATLASMSSERFRAVASLSGCMNQTVTIDMDSDLTVFDSSDQREIEMRSPEAYALSFKCPARLYYGTNELLLSGAIERTAESARASGLDVEAVEVSGDHFTSVEPAMRMSIPFFQKQLKPRKTPERM